MSDPSRAWSRRLRLFVSAIEQVQQRSMRATQEKYGLTDAQAGVVLLLASHPGMRASDVANCLGVSFPSATNMMNRLQQHGLIHREPMGHDRRSVSISLTPKGASAAADLHDARERGIQRLLDATGQAEAGRCMQWIETLIGAASVSMDDQVSRLCLHCGAEHEQNCPLTRTAGIADVSSWPVCRSKQMNDTLATPLSERNSEK